MTSPTIAATQRLQTAQQSYNTALDTDRAADAAVFTAESTVNAQQTAYATAQGNVAASAALITSANTNLTTSTQQMTAATTAITTADAAAKADQASVTTAEATARTTATGVTTAQTAATTATAAYTTAQAAGKTATTELAAANAAVSAEAAVMTTATTAATTAETKLTAADTGVTTAETALQTADAGVTTATAAMKTADTGVTTATTALKTADTAVTTATAAVKKADTGVTTATSALTKATSTTAASNKSVTSALSGVTKAHGGVTSAKSAITSAQGNVSSAQNELSSAENALSSAQARLNANPKDANARAAVNSARSRVNSARSKLSGARNALSTARSRLADAQRAEAEAQRKLEEARTRLAEAKAAVARAKTALAKAKQAQAEAKTKLEEAQKIEAEAKTKLADAQKAQATATKALEAAKQVQTDAKTKLADATKTQTGARTALEAAKTRLTSETKKLGELKKTAATATTKVDDATKATAAAKTKADDAATALTTAREADAMAKADVTAKKAVAVKSTSAVSDARAKLTAATTKVTVAKKTVTELESKKQAVTARAAAAKTALDKAQNELTSHKTAAASAQTRADRAQAALSDAKGKLRVAETDGMSAGARKMLQMDERETTSSTATQNADAARIDKTLTPAQKVRIAADQKQLQSQAAAARKSQSTAVGGASGAADNPKDYFHQVQAGTRVADSRTDGLYQQYFQTHEYYVDKDGVAYQASYYGGKMNLSRVNEAVGKSGAGAHVTRDTSIALDHTGARDTTTTLKTPPATSKHPQQVYTEQTSADAAGRITAKKTDTTEHSQGKDGSTASVSETRTYKGADKLTNLTKTRKLALGDTTDTKVSSTDVNAVSGKITKITDAHQLSEPGHSLDEKNVQVVGPTGRVASATFDSKEHTDATPTTHRADGKPAADTTVNQVTKMDTAGVPATSSTTTDSVTGDTKRHDVTDTTFKNGKPREVKSNTTTDSKSTDKDGNAVTVNDVTRSDINLNAGGKPVKIATDSTSTTDALGDKPVDEDGKVTSDDRPRIHTVAHTVSLIDAKGAAISFDPTSGAPTNATPIGTIDVTTKVTNGPDGAHVQISQQHGGLIGATTNWTSLRSTVQALNESGGIQTQDATDYTAGQLDANGMPKKGVDGKDVADLHVDNRGWWDKHKRLISTVMSVTGGILAVTGVGTALGGALLLAGGAIALSDDLPGFVNHPSWQGAMAVGLDGVGMVAGGASAFSAFAKGSAIALEGAEALQGVKGAASLANGVTDLNFAAKGLKVTTAILDTSAVKVVGAVAMGQQAFGIEQQIQHDGIGSLSAEDWLGALGTIATVGAAKFAGRSNGEALDEAGGTLKTSVVRSGDLVTHGAGGAKMYTVPKVPTIEPAKVTPHGTPADKPELVARLKADGIKFNENELVSIGTTLEGKVVFLETGNERAGAQHLNSDKRVAEFDKAGIAADQINTVAMDAVTTGKPIGISGKDRPVYEVKVNGETRRIAVTVSDNGFIVGANPVGTAAKIKPFPAGHPMESATLAEVGDSSAVGGMSGPGVEPAFGGAAGAPGAAASTGVRATSPATEPISAQLSVHGQLKSVRIVGTLADDRVVVTDAAGLTHVTNTSALVHSSFPAVAERTLPPGTTVRSHESSSMDITDDWKVIRHGGDGTVLLRKGANTRSVTADELMYVNLDRIIGAKTWTDETGTSWRVGKSDGIRAKRVATHPDGTITIDTIFSTGLMDTPPILEAAGFASAARPTLTERLNNKFASAWDRYNTLAGVWQVSEGVRNLQARLYGDRYSPEPEFHKTPAEQLPEGLPGDPDPKLHYGTVRRTVGNTNPTGSDIYQGAISDCYLQTAMGSFVDINPDAAKSMVRRRRGGIEVTMGDKKILMSRKLPLNVQDQVHYGAQQGPLWSAYVEKGAAIVKGGSYDNIDHGGNSHKAVGLLRDELSSWRRPLDSDPVAALKKFTSDQFANTERSVGTTKLDDNISNLWIYENYHVFDDHAYSFEGTYVAADGETMVKMRNPHGTKQPRDIPLDLLSRIAGTYYAGTSGFRAPKTVTEPSA